MKATINGKRYDTSRCETLGEYDHRTYSNNYCGTTRLKRANDGALLVWTDTNGQDLHMSDSLRLFDPATDSMDSFDLTPEQEARCEELGLIKIV